MSKRHRHGRPAQQSAITDDWVTDTINSSHPGKPDTEEIGTSEPDGVPFSDGLSDGCVDKPENLSHPQPQPDFTASVPQENSASEPINANQQPTCHTKRIPDATQEDKGPAPTETDKLFLNAIKEALDEFVAGYIMENLQLNAPVTEDDYYRAITIMPLFRKKRDVYSQMRMSARQATENAIRSSYCSALPNGCISEEFILNMGEAVAEQNEGLPPYKRIVAAIQSDNAQALLKKVGSRLGEMALDAEHNTFIAAARYIHGGNYMDLSGGKTQDKEMFCKAYSRFVGETLAENIRCTTLNTENTDRSVTALRADGVLIDYNLNEPMPEALVR